tara:strand:+ start:280 stop:519 length:240 start_codon:yes stop_codon:yes gene_type:complete
LASLPPPLSWHHLFWSAKEMKPGELVTLSAYGQKLKMFTSLRNKVGLIISVMKDGSCHVRWQGFSTNQYMERKDIKKAK